MKRPQAKYKYLIIFVLSTVLVSCPMPEDPTLIYNSSSKAIRLEIVFDNSTEYGFEEMYWRSFSVNIGNSLFGKTYTAVAKSTDPLRTISIPDSSKYVRHEVTIEPGTALQVFRNFLGTYWDSFVKKAVIVRYNGLEFSLSEQSVKNGDILVVDVIRVDQYGKVEGKLVIF